MSALARAFETLFGRSDWRCVVMILNSIFDALPIPIMDATRYCMRSSRALLNSTPTALRETTLPAFLVPAFAQRQRTSRFSTSTQRRSKIGSAPLSLPPNVTFEVIPPPAQLPNARVSRTQVGATVKIEGPLGKMSMQIPPYINIGMGDGVSSRSVTIMDTEDKKQKSMWGVYTSIDG